MSVAQGIFRQLYPSSPNPCLYQRTTVSGSREENSLPSMLLKRPEFFILATVGRLCTSDGKVVLGLRLKGASLEIFRQIQVQCVKLAN